jgi:hypothetical protein
MPRRQRFAGSHSGLRPAARSRAPDFASSARVRTDPHGRSPPPNHRGSSRFSRGAVAKTSAAPPMQCSCVSRPHSSPRRCATTRSDALRSPLRWRDGHGYRDHRAPAARDPFDDGESNRGRLDHARQRRERIDPSGRCVVVVAVVGTPGHGSDGLRIPCVQDAAGGTPSAGSASFSRNATSSRLTRLRLGTSASGNHRASSLEPPISLRSSPLTTVARYTMRIA